MEKRLCYCKSCDRFFIIAPDKACPKCGRSMLSSVVTEAEWNQSNASQRTAYKNSLSALGNPVGDRRHEHASPNENKSADKSANITPNKTTSANTKPSPEKAGGAQTQKPKKNSILGKLLLVAAAGFIAFNLFKPHNGACADYESAGKKVYKQLIKYDPEVYVSYNSDHYNPVTGVNTDINNIMREACKNNGDPRAGDHLAMNANWTEEEYVAVEQRDGTDNLNIKLTMSYETTKEQEQELKEKADSVLAGLRLDGASDYEKVRAIYNYICSNVTYDYDHLDDDSYRLKHTAYAAAVNRTAVCSGIADLFYYLATSAGLEARTTFNDVHAWNIVKVNGRYYYLDPTWDLGVNESDYRYFLRGSKDLYDILSGPDRVAHRTSIMGNFLLGPKHPLTNVQEEYTISEQAYSQ